MGGVVKCCKMAYTISARPAVDLSGCLPIAGAAKDGGELVLDRATPEQLPDVQAMLNYVIGEGNSYPYDAEMDFDAFKAYYLSHDAFTVREKGSGETVAAFYIKPNFPGRCGHICNAGFLVRDDKRGNGLGRFMSTHFLDLAKELGYEAVFFNLVFTDNKASLGLYLSLGFKQVGAFPRAAKKRDGTYQDAVQLHYDLTAH